MAQLAIKGHATRGSEVITLLEMLGGKNIYNLTGTKEIWYILSDGTIEHSAYLFEEKGFTLEEFFERFPYKVGDKVTHNVGILMNVVHMCWDAKCNVIRYDIQSPVDNNYKLKAMLAEHLLPYKEETMEIITIEDFKANTKEWLIDKLGNMSMEDALQTISNIYNELHEPQYPKTYEECAELLDTFCGSIEGHKGILLSYLQQLLVCRDAYWKIAGNWQPDWTKANERKYCIVNTEGNITKWVQKTTSKILAFPTEEMRDAFYENFKDLIENVKELL